MFEHSRVSSGRHGGEAAVLPARAVHVGVHAPGGPSLLAYQRAVGNRETGQLLAQLRDAGHARPDRLHATAQRGMSGASQELPHREAIARAFGGHDLSDVRAHIGGPAAAAAAAMGTSAYAVDGAVAFADAPDLHEAAHEAAHVIQRRSGGPASRGAGGDRAESEREADAVADRVVRGESAAELLPACAPGAAAAGPGGPVQMYTKLDSKLLQLPYDLVADDGRMAVKDHSREAWAESRSIEKSNSVLAAIKSKAKIEEIAGSTIPVTPPGLAALEAPRMLTKFRMVDRVKGTELDLKDDCGTAGQQMLGAEATGPWPDLSFRAVHKQGITGRAGYQMDDQGPGGAMSTTEQMSSEIYIRIFATEKSQKLSRDEALQAWMKLDVDERSRLAEKYGINEYAVPKVGQGITIGTEYDMPGFARSKGRYPFHFGFNVMASGNDYMTVEDYAQSGVPYYFDMYGPAAKSQAWAQDPSNTDALGNRTTTMVVEHATAFEGKTNADGAHFVDDPANYTTDRALAKGTTVTVIRKRVNWMKVEVTSGRYAGKSGWILNHYFEGAK